MESNCREPNRTSTQKRDHSPASPSKPDIPPPALLAGWLARKALRGLRAHYANRTKATARPCRWRTRFPTTGIILSWLSVTGFVPAAEGADLVPSPTLEMNALFDATEETAKRAGFYFGTRGRIGVNSDTSLQSAAGNVDIAYDPSFGTAALIGYGTSPVFGPIGFRGELEAGFFTSEVDQIDVAGVSRSSETSVGSLTGFTGFANGYLDAHFSAFEQVKGTPLSRVTPFVGAGIGVARVGLDEVGTFADGIIADDWDTSVAFQVSAGVRVNVTPRTLVELGYRREIIPDIELNLRDGSSSDFDLTRDLFTVSLQRQF